MTLIDPYPVTPLVEPPDTSVSLPGSKSITNRALVCAALAEGTTRFRDGAELRVKETDRIAAIADGLSRLGVVVREEPDGLIVEGGRVLRGGSVDARGDHRVAMALAVAALVARHPVRIRDAQSMAVSDPEFLRTLDGLRGDRS